MMDLADCLANIKARADHLTALEQPGPVDLGPDDNEKAQDDLFAELSACRAILTLAAARGIEVEA